MRERKGEGRKEKYGLAKLARFSFPLGMLSRVNNWQQELNTIHKQPQGTMTPGRLRHTLATAALSVALVCSFRHTQTWIDLQLMSLPPKAETLLVGSAGGVVC